MATSDVTQGLSPDEYGQLHPVETEDMIATKLALFEQEVEKLPIEVTASLKKAQQACPDQLTDDFKLMFLRSEVFNADVSVIEFE